MHPYLTEIYVRQQREQLATTAERRRMILDRRPGPAVWRLPIGRVWSRRRTTPPLALIR